MNNNKVKISKIDNETIEREFNEFREYLLDKKEIPKIIKTNKFEIIIFRDLKNNEMISYFVILKDKEILTNYPEEFKDLNDLFLKIIKKLKKEIEEIQKSYEKQSLFKKNINQKDLFALFSLLNRVDLLTEFVNSNLKIIVSLYNEKRIKRGILDEFKQILSEINFLDQKLENLIQIYDIYFNLKNNQVLNKISIIAFLFLIPSTIFSMYGMNFRYIPFYDHPYGFIIVSVFAFLIMVVLYKFLIKRVDF